MGTKPFSMRSAFQPCHGPGAYHRGWDVGMLGCYSGLIRFDLDHLGFRLGSEIILDIDLQRRVDTAKTLTSEPPEVSIQTHCISPQSLSLESSGVARRCSCLELSWWHHRDITPWTFVYCLFILFIVCWTETVAQQPSDEVTPAQGARQALHPIIQWTNGLDSCVLTIYHLPIPTIYQCLVHQWIIYRGYTDFQV
jgi:hypothetical protein